MVYGVYHPSTFGIFGPQGTLSEPSEAQVDEVVEVFRREWPAEQIAKYEAFGPEGFRHYALSKVSSREIDKFKRESQTGPVIAPLRPHAYTVKGRVPKLGAWLEVTNGLNLVADELRAIIERLEHRVHQFWPVDVVLPTGARPPHNYHALVIGQFRDSLLDEQSDLWESGRLKFAGDTTAKAFKRVVVSADRIRGAHLWRERRLARPEICISNALRSAIAEAGLKVPTPKPLTVAAE